MSIDALNHDEWRPSLWAISVLVLSADATDRMEPDPVAYDMFSTIWHGGSISAKTDMGF